MFKIKFIEDIRQISWQRKYNPKNRSVIYHIEQCIRAGKVEGCMLKNVRSGLLLAGFFACLAGIAALSIHWRITSWQHVFYIGMYTLVIFVLGVAGGAIIGWFIGRGKGRVLNGLGLLLFLALLGTSVLVFYQLTIIEPNGLTAAEKTLIDFFLLFGSGTSAMLGRSLVRRARKMPDT